MVEEAQSAMQGVKQEPHKPILPSHLLLISLDKLMRLKSEELDAIPDEDIKTRVLKWNRHYQKLLFTTVTDNCDLSIPASIPSDNNSIISSSSSSSSSSNQSSIPSAAVASASSASSSSSSPVSSRRQKRGRGEHDAPKPDARIPTKKQAAEFVELEDSAKKLERELREVAQRVSNHRRTTAVLAAEAVRDDLSNKRQRMQDEVDEFERKYVEEERKILSSLLSSSSEISSSSSLPPPPEQLELAAQRAVEAAESAKDLALFMNEAMQRLVNLQDTLEQAGKLATQTPSRIDQVIAETAIIAANNGSNQLQHQLQPVSHLSAVAAALSRKQPPS